MDFRKCFHLSLVSRSDTDPVPPFEKHLEPVMDTTFKQKSDTDSYNVPDLDPNKAGKWSLFLMMIGA